MSLVVELSVEHPAWTEAIADLQAFAERALGAAVAVACVDVAADGEVSCLLCDDEAIRRLNADWRGKDAPTNVLSFPAAPAPRPHGRPRPLGDIALAFETVAREARRDGMPFAAHAEHLLVHGFLHLIGHDHETDAEAERMEALETRAMQRLGRPDPYREAADHDAGVGAP